MNILSEDFLSRLRIAIVEIVKDALITLSKSTVSEKRYLKKVEAKKYVGGVNDKGFENLIAHGLKEVRIDGFLRYDKKDIDELMEKFKI
ncbi:hypothetical protein [Enterococcus xiangfangensis]|uniref:hypothetical protein n=1 Tax=Enterococcus xiangfangensis TaxID=1296537 RepID=UPI003D183EA9|nr:hypothetical protein [Enterococcus asini]